MISRDFGRREGEITRGLWGTGLSIVSFTVEDCGGGRLGTDGQRSAPAFALQVGQVFTLFGAIEPAETVRRGGDDEGVSLAMVSFRTPTGGRLNKKGSDKAPASGDDLRGPSVRANRRARPPSITRVELFAPITTASDRREPTGGRPAPRRRASKGRGGGGISGRASGELYPQGYGPPVPLKASVTGRP